MKDEDKTERQLLNELEKLRRRVAELEESEAGLKRTEQLLGERTLLGFSEPSALSNLDRA